MTATPQQPMFGVGAIALPRPRVVGPHRLWRTLANIVVGIVAVVAVALAAALTVVPAVSGAQTLTVLSGSMGPAIPTGSVVAVLPVDPRAVAVGDVITYATNGAVTGRSELVTHRVTAVEQRPDGPLFVTKGDASRVADALPVTAAQVRGEAWYHIPWVGAVRDAVFTRTGGLFAGALALLFVGVWLLGRIGRSARPEGRSGHAAR